MSFKVTDESLDEFGSEIIKAGEMLQMATLSLRSLYVVNSSSVDSFVKLRRNITNKARLYSERVLPVSNNLIRAIQNFCDYYTFYDYDEFKEVLKYFIAEVNEVSETCELTLKLYEGVLMEFKNSENEVNEVLKQLKSKTEEYEQKKEVLMESANVKLNWAVGLALIPVVNVIAGPILYKKSNNSIRNAIAESEEELLAVAAAEAIKGPLITSLSNLVSTFDYISKFFLALVNEMNAIKDDNYSKVVHYKRMERKGLVIRRACRIYLSKVPDALTNLQAIPDDYDKNYVKEWLSERS